MDKQILRVVMVDNQREVEAQNVVKRKVRLEDFANYVLVGIRRAGKSFILYQRMQELLSQGIGWDQMLYVNFEDERLQDITVLELNQILEVHLEAYGKKPILFLDEIQVVPGWEKFARRLADSKYRVYITGSNAKMLSGEIMTTLGGRYIPIDVYPYSFEEFLDVSQTPHTADDQLATISRSAIINRFNDYLRYGGFPESVGLPVKRDYLNSVYQKIYLSDIAARNGITNVGGLRLMLKKMAESVKQPQSFNRIASIITGAGRKISVNSVTKYVDGAQQAWLITPISNIASKMADRESHRKYYFTDNGLLGLFLVNQETALLENLVAIALFRQYGREDQVFFFNRGDAEIDFYVPEAELAVQVCFSMKDEETRKREISAFSHMPSRLPCNRRIVVTYDEEYHEEYDGLQIEVIPAWKWMIGYE